MVRWIEGILKGHFILVPNFASDNLLVKKEILELKFHLCHLLFKNPIIFME